MSLIARTCSYNLKRGATILTCSDLKCVPQRYSSNDPRNTAIHYDYLIHPRPKAGKGFNFRRIINYEDKYTVKPLTVTNLAGRDPITGRIVVGGLGGGVKHKYHWIQWIRKGPTTADEPPIEEEVIQIIKDGNRSGFVMLVAGGDEMKYYLAPHEIQPGDIIRTSSYVPNIPLQDVNVGDAYPLGALMDGTMIHNLEMFPGEGSKILHAAGTYATILRKVDDKVHVKLPNKHEMILDKRCMAVVGRMSNLEYSSIPIGSYTNLFELGFRPRSGLWQRKDGRFGRKIHPTRIITVSKKTPLLPTKPLDSTRLPKFSS